MSQFLSNNIDDDDSDRRRFPYSNVQHTPSPMVSIGIPILYGIIASLCGFLFSIYNDTTANKYKLDAYIDKQANIESINSKEVDKIMIELKTVSTKMASIEDTLMQIMISKNGKK
jgi:hypothetical protein